MKKESLKELFLWFSNLQEEIKQLERDAGEKQVKLESLKMVKWNVEDIIKELKDENN